MHSVFYVLHNLLCNINILFFVKFLHLLRWINLLIFKSYAPLSIPIVISASLVSDATRKQYSDLWHRSQRLVCRHHQIMTIVDPSLRESYIAIFISLRTRAIHIQLVFDLTTEAFFGALWRFIARRSEVVEIHSDNGTNFKEAANQLNWLYELLKTEKHASSVHHWCSLTRPSPCGRTWRR